MKKYLLIIDVQFLIEARVIVQEIYEKIYSDPEDEFYKPKKYNEKIKLSQLVKECDYYAGFGAEFTPKVYVIGSNYQHFETVFDLADFENINANKLTTNNSPWNEAENIIKINSEDNILLVADNQFYASMIEANSSNHDIRLIRYMHDLRGNAISSMDNNDFRYQDICFPLGICLGLKRGEL